jgi:hypothetical protein
MPKVITDDALLAEVLAIEKNVGSRSKLALQLGVDRATFWRFCQTGRAIDKTREVIRQGLMRNKNETIGKVGISIENSFGVNIHDDMQSLRSLCNTVLTVLDGYEKLLANSMANR